MEEKRYRQKWLDDVDQARIRARAAAEKELTKADTGSVKLTIRQSTSIQKGQSQPQGATTRTVRVRSALRSLREAQLFDSAQLVSERIAAAQSGDLPIGNSKTLTLRVLGLIGDPQQPEAVRLATLRAFRAATFSTRLTAAWRPEYLRTLRAIVNNETNSVSTLALQMLALEQDGQTLNDLQEGLRGTKEAKIPQIEAVQYLSVDDHGDHFDLLRDVATGGGPEKNREQAIRGLASDPGARDLLVGLVKNSQELPAVRQAALLSLRIQSPATYQEQADRIVRDTDEDDSLRAAAITALRLDTDPKQSPLTPIIQNIHDEARSPLLKKAARLYLPNEE